MKQFAPLERRRDRLRETRSGEKGYVLLTMLLVVALMGIFALAAYTTVEFEIRRDQETEMIHRGVQYTRAIRAYYKKFQRYPTKLEDLDNTNNLRYLRKHYKDPLNKNQDFRLLHYGEQGVTLAGGLVGMGGGSIPGASPAGSPGGLNGPGQSASAFGGPGLGGGSGFGNSGVNSSGVFAQSSGNGPNSNTQGPTDQGTTPGGSDTSAQGATGGAQGNSSSSGQQLIASGPIVGVASFCKKSTIREFNKKKRYNEWQFLYDPTIDRGGLITTPYQPLQNFATNNLQTGGTNGSSSPSGQSSFGQSGFGQSGQSGFGQSGSGQSGFGQSGFGNNSGGSTPTPPPTSTPQQQ